MEKQFYQVIVDGVFEALKDKNFKTFNSPFPPRSFL